MSKIHIVNGDLLSTKATYICHQTNCCGVMGRGIAAQIRSKYPDVFIRYQKYCSEHRRHDLLGRILLVPTDDGKVICNLFGQERYGNDKQYTDMTALKRCFQQLDHIVPESEMITMPYMIGCGNGGGNWNEILNLIRTEFLRHDVVIYKL